MNYIKVSNSGTFDVPTAVNLLGASVKSKEDAIGMFGSGLKYALAQAMREGFSVHITSGENIYEVCTSPIVFKDKTFEKLYLRDIETDEEFITPITTDFGKENWDRKWYVYREIVSNAMDEDQYRISNVKEIRKSPNDTCIYLSMEDFGDIYEDHKKYFVEKQDDWIKAGEGIVFKKGVKVGDLPGCLLNFQYKYINIDESRSMDFWSARSSLGSMMNSSKSLSVWTNFFLSTINTEISLSVTSEEVCLVVKKALKKLHGKFALCPDDQNIINDLIGLGITPVVISNNWTFLPDIIPTFRTYLNSDNSVLRSPNREERELIDWGLGIAKDYGMLFTGDIYLFEDELVGGMADMMKGHICINQSYFSDKREFLKTLFHSIGNIDSGKKDWDRGFALYFIDKIVDKSILSEGNKI